MPLALTLIDLDGFDAIDPATILIIMVLLAGSSLAVSVVAIISVLDKKRGRV